ncbi:MAG: MFS transporter [Magnetococcales bacterium]|nr:MFS transporter [Magnetococcales bacterium]
MRRRMIYGVLGSYYALFFAFLGVWIPYWPLYLANLGADSQAIGWLMALALGIKVLGPPVWGRLADGSSRQRVTVATSFATFVAFCLFFAGSSVPFLIFTTIIFSFFHAGPLPLVEATTMETVTRRGWDYGRIRLWGSVGFIVLALGMGPVIDGWGMAPVLPILAALLFLTALLTLALPVFQPPPRSASQQVPPKLFSLSRVRWFYFSTLLMQFSHGAYYGFMSIHLQNHGYSKTAIGILWVLGVVAEVAVMLWSKQLLRRFGLALVLSGSLGLAFFRWGIYAFTLYWPLLVLGQILHAATFASFHIAAVRRTFEMAPVHSRATAQAWYSAFSFGIGGGGGLVLSGYLFDLVGAEKLFALMAAAAALGIFASLRSCAGFDAAAQVTALAPSMVDTQAKGPGA